MGNLDNSGERGRRAYVREQLVIYSHVTESGTWNIQEAAGEDCLLKSQLPLQKPPELENGNFHLRTRPNCSLGLLIHYGCSPGQMHRKADRKPQSLFSTWYLTLIKEGHKSQTEFKTQNNPGGMGESDLNSPSITKEQT